MKINYQYAQTQNNVVYFALRNGADSSVVLKIDGLCIPQMTERDCASLDVCEGDETTVRQARKALVTLLTTRWGMSPPTWDRQVEISTSAGTLRGSTSSETAFRIEEETGELVIDGFRAEEYNGAYNAIGQGTGYKIEWADQGIESIESTIGTFVNMKEYEDARRKAGLPIWNDAVAAC